MKELTDDAKVTLLLCGRFQNTDVKENIKPLTLREYNPLADWMRDYKLRPADLLKSIGTNHLKNAPPTINSDRIMQLLSREADMTLALEIWMENGVWVICRNDLTYPGRIKQHLRKQAPPILYGVGDIELLNHGGLAIVGSRNVDKRGENFTRKVAHDSAQQGFQIVSGGARGVDQLAMLSALEAGGSVSGIMADSLIKKALSRNYSDRIRDRKLSLVSPYSPDAGFNVGNAMGRNKLIYAIADFALVISSEVKKGGTWSGVTEELNRETPRAVFVRDEDNTPEGNKALMKLGAHSFPKPPWHNDLSSRLKKKQMKNPQNRIAKQLNLFERNEE